MKDLNDPKLQSYLIRPRAKWSLEGQNPSNYFCALDKIVILQRQSIKYNKEDGQIIKDQNLILIEIEHFYQNQVKKIGQII